MKPVLLLAYGFYICWPLAAPDAWLCNFICQSCSSCFWEIVCLCHTVFSSRCEVLCIDPFLKSRFLRKKFGHETSEVLVDADSTYSYSTLATGSVLCKIAQQWGPILSVKVEEKILPRYRCNIHVSAWFLFACMSCTVVTVAIVLTWYPVAATLYVRVPVIEERSA